MYNKEEPKIVHNLCEQGCFSEEGSRKRLAMHSSLLSKHNKLIKLLLLERRRQWGNLNVIIWSSLHIEENSRKEKKLILLWLFYFTVDITRPDYGQTSIEKNKNKKGQFLGRATQTQHSEVSECAAKIWKKDFAQHWQSKTFQTLLPGH